MSSYAHLKNVARLMTTVEEVRDRAPGLPGICVFSGPSGYGKTFASVLAQNAFRGVRIEVGESWTRKKLLQAILEEFKETAGRGSIPDLADRVKIKLSEDYQAPLIIDEADKLVDKKMIDIVREIAEVSLAPVVLIGEEQLPAKLRANERVHNRVLRFTLAEACDIEDAAELAKIYAPRVTIGDGLLGRIVLISQGRARRIAVNLNNVRIFAQNEGLERVSLADYAADFYTNEAPTRQRRLKAV